MTAQSSGRVCDCCNPREGRRLRDAGDELYQKLGEGFRVSAAPNDPQRQTPAFAGLCRMLVL